ncbi:MAG TPA: 3-hydroxyacyl-CoA dehydrogenase [Thermohalobaculum sp.]|nr:3-hydroxyacyl-CoA dehydrogenase [Thermohalobaculum sp.]
MNGHTMKQPDAADYVVGVVGAGAMGQGIIQVSVQGGMRTLILDAKPGAAEAAKQAVAGRIARLVEKGRLGEDEAEAAVARMEAVEDAAGLAPCDAVVEAIIEDLEIKRETFAKVEAAVGPDCIIASNTSSIPIASIARTCERRGRIAGMHFFNPVPLMKLVEIIRAAETSDATVEALTGLGKRMGRTPVTVKDSPGFLVNMGGRAFTTEGLRIVHEGVATPAQVDAIMRDCRHFRMGPFELMDLTGIDVNFPVSMIVYEGYLHDPRLKTAPNHKAMADAGLLGRKAGRGWFGYEDGKPLERPSPDHATDAAPAREVQLAEADARLEAFCAEIGLGVGRSGPFLAAPIGEDATHVSLRTGVAHEALVCLDLTGDTSKRVTLMTAPGADPAARDMVAAALAASGRAVTAIKDSPGFVAQRMSATIANLGCYMAEIGLASPADIDLAMQLGLNYPLGPLALAEDLGPKETLKIMEQLHEITGEDRYRPTMWLKRRARLGLPVTTV